jgi:hypothetical protein
MLFKEALKQVQKNKQIKEYEKKGYFLNSGISLLGPGSYEIKDWIFTYYNPAENKVVETAVSDSVEVKEPAEPIKPTAEALGVKSIKTNSDKMMQKASAEFKKKQLPLSQTIVTVQGAEPKWSFNFITKVLEIVTIKIDAEKGNILGAEVTPLTKPA